MNAFIENVDPAYNLTIESNIDYITKKCFMAQDLRAICFKKIDNDSKEEAIIGICIYYVEVACVSARRIIIAHLSVDLDNIDEFENWIEKSTEYIFTNDTCKEIFISLNYHMNPTTNKLILNKEISIKFKEKGFKWKQLINDAISNRRSTVFFLQRNDEKYGMGHNKELECLEPIKFVSCGIFSDYASNESVWITKTIRDFVSPNDRQYIVLYNLLNYFDYNLQKYDIDQLEEMGNYGNLLLKLRDLTDFRIGECFKEDLFNNDV